MPHKCYFFCIMKNLGLLEEDDHQEDDIALYKEEQETQQHLSTPVEFPVSLQEHDCCLTEPQQLENCLVHSFEVVPLYLQASLAVHEALFMKILARALKNQKPFQTSANSNEQHVFK